MSRGGKVTHGLSRTRFYVIWRNMKARCHNENNHDFYRYGGKGIIVCDNWHIFINFSNDMYEKYLKHVDEYGEKDTTLERIDNNKGYNRENCKWATRKEQTQNKTEAKFKLNHNYIYVGISPNNVFYYFFKTKLFAEQNNLNHWNILSVLQNKQKTYKGWKFYKTNI